MGRIISDAIGGYEPELLVRYPRLDWVIAGGESGHNARPSHPDWFRSLRDQCKAAGVSFFMKQIADRGRKLPIAQWPADLVVREFPEAAR